MAESEVVSAASQDIVDAFESMFAAEDGAPPETVLDHRMEIADVAQVPVDRYKRLIRVRGTLANDDLGNVDAALKLVSSLK